MLSKKALKQVGILGVSFGLIASPLAFGFEDEPKSGSDQEQYQDPAQAQEPMGGEPQTGQGAQDEGDGFGGGTDPMPDEAQDQGAGAQPQGETETYEYEEGEEETPWEEEEEDEDEDEGEDNGAW